METKNRERLLLILTGSALALMVLNWLIIQPLTHAWQGRTKDIAELRKKLSDGQMLLTREDVIKGRWDHMTTNALSATPTVAERQLFDAFDRWVKESKVTEGSFKPQLRQTDDNYSVMECHADVTGSYDTIIRFLYDLESDPAGLQLLAVDLTSRDEAGRQISLGIELSGLLTPPPQNQ